MMYDVVSLGEFIIDFTPYSNPENKIVFEQKPGGAPCNLAAGVAKLGKKAAFIGKVGKDMFGDVCIETLEQAGIDTKGVVMTDACNTTLAFVKLLPSGDRRFSFYRNPGADMMLAFDEVDLSLIDNTKIFHFGSVSMTHEPARTATMEAAKYAKSKGKKRTPAQNFVPSRKTEDHDYLRQAMEEAGILPEEETPEAAETTPPDAPPQAET